MPKKPPYKFRLFSAILTTVCIVLVGDAIAPTASIGYSVYFWWIIMLLGFFIPYGLISAELGTQYPSEGGLYTWIKTALGPKWAGRVAWLYWINFPFWVAALANLVTTYLAGILGLELSWPIILGLQLLYIILVNALSVLRISQSDWLSNLGAIAKILFMAGLGALGVYVLCTQGTANPVNSWTDFIPFIGTQGLDLAGLGFVALIIFSLLGFEVVPTFGNDLKNPKKEIPRAIFIGGILVAAFYLIASFGIQVAIPVQDLQSDSGMLDTYGQLMTAAGLSAGLIRAIVVAVGGLFIYTLVANVASWNFGVNSIAAYAAADGALPQSWTKRNKDGVPYVPAIWTCVISCILTIIGGVAVELSDAPLSLFWVLFSLSLAILLLAYIPLFFAFWKLHQKGPQIKTGFWIEGGKGKILACTLIPFFLLVFSFLFMLFPDLNLEMFYYNWPLIVGVCAVVIFGEVMVHSVHKSAEASPGLRTRHKTKKK